MKASSPRGSVLAAVLAAATAVVLAFGVPVASATRSGHDRVATTAPRPRAAVPIPSVEAVRDASLESAPAQDPSRRARPAAFTLARIEHDTPMRARPGAGPVVGTLPARSKYYATPTVAWIQRVSDDGRYGKLAVPYSASRRSGWIPLRGLHRSTTRVRVEVDLSRHRVSVERRGRPVLATRAATGAAATPTPTGRYFVTDLVPFPGGGPYGAFAFGISGIQPRLPPGWTGGNQLAIHGTDDPGSIGRPVSAGCVRVSAGALAGLRKLLRLGTPVVIHR